MTRSNHLKTLLLAAFAAFTFGSTASAVVVFSENFDGLVGGTDTLAAATPSSVWNGSLGYPIEAGDAHFPTNHLFLKTTAANFQFANWTDGVNRDVVTVSFDIFDPGTMTSADAGMRLATSRETSNASFVDISGASLPDNVISHYDIVSNITAAPITYEDGVNSVAANSYDVWLDGIQVVTAGALVGNGSGSIDGVGFWARRPDAALRIDNFEVRDTAYATAAVPEPEGFALMGLALMGLALISRRR